MSSPRGCLDWHALATAGVAGLPGCRVTAAGPAHRSDLAGQPACVGQRAAQQDFDLGIGAAQLVAGPPGQGVVDGRVQPQQDALAFAHGVTVPAVTGWRRTWCARRRSRWPWPCRQPARPPLDASDITYIAY